MRPKAHRSSPGIPGVYVHLDFWPLSLLFRPQLPPKGMGRGNLDGRTAVAAAAEALLLLLLLLQSSALRYTVETAENASSSSHCTDTPEAASPLGPTPPAHATAAGICVEYTGYSLGCLLMANILQELHFTSKYL